VSERSKLSQNGAPSIWITVSYMDGLYNTSLLTESSTDSKHRIRNPWWLERYRTANTVDGRGSTSLRQILRIASPHMRSLSEHMLIERTSYILAWSPSKLCGVLLTVKYIHPIYCFRYGKSVDSGHSLQGVFKEVCIPTMCKSCPCQPDITLNRASTILRDPLGGLASFLFRTHGIDVPYYES